MRKFYLFSYLGSFIDFSFDLKLNISLLEKCASRSAFALRGYIEVGESGSFVAGVAFGYSESSFPRIVSKSSSIFF